MKNFFINKTAHILPTHLYLKYLLLLSKLLYVRGYDSPRSIQTIVVDIAQVGPVTLFKVKTFAGSNFWLINPVRINRLLKGIDHAGKRLWERYFLHSYGRFSREGAWIDVGANIGELSLFLAKRFSLVYAVEPDPVAHYCLTRNLEGVPNCFIFPFALGRESGELPISLKPNSADSSLVLPNDSNNPVFPVRVVRGDDVFLDLLNIRREIYLKMDAEGYEPEVLMGLKKILKSLNFVSIDAGQERNGEDTSEACYALLHESGFDAQIMKSWIVTANQRVQ